jgi:hypothetical protein
MRCMSLHSYKEARELCSGKRFLTKGRKLDNYSRMIFVPATGTSGEHIDIYTWRQRRAATMYPDETVVISEIMRFSTHQQYSFFTLWVGRDKKRYRYVTDVSGNKYLTDYPIKGKYLMGRLILTDGTPVPTLEKDDAASLQWRRDKQAMDRTFKTCCQLGAFDHLTQSEARMVAGRTYNDFSAEAFVEMVRANDAHAMAHYIGAVQLRSWVNYANNGTFSAILREAYEAHYNRHRRDILIAAGARVAT